MAGLDSIMQAAKFLPASVAVKALQKFNPKFKNYFANAAAYGFDVNNALDYLNQRFESQHSKPFEQRLEQREGSGQARPDEIIAKKEIQQSKMPGKIARSAAAFGAGALLGGIPGAASQAIPQDSQQEERPEHIPGLGQYKAEHMPGLGQYKGEHMPGLGQVKMEHGPKEISAREKSLKRHAEMTKKKKLLDQLQQEFENEYGQGNVPPSGLSTASQGSNVNERIQQAAPGGRKSELIQALMEVKKILQ